jgi:hypothetical protein
LPLGMRISIYLPFSEHRSKGGRYSYGLPSCGSLTVCSIPSFICLSKSPHGRCLVIFFPILSRTTLHGTEGGKQKSRDSLPPFTKA